MNPAEGAAGLALVALSFLVLYFLCISLAHAIIAILRAVAGYLNTLPAIGPTVAGWMEGIASRISHAVGGLASGIDKMIGAAWHRLASYVDKWLSNFVAHSSVLLTLAEIVGSAIYSVSGLRSFVRSISYVAHAALTLADKLEKQYHGIEQRVRTIEREIGAGIGNDVRTAVRDLQKEYKAVDKAITDTLPKEIAYAEGEVSALAQFIRALPGVRYLDWAAGIVAVGLGAELFNLFKCPTFLGKTLGRGCGLWNALEDILGLLADAVIFADLCQVPVWINEIFGPIEGFLVGLISDAANAACAQPPAGFVSFSVEPAQLPPAQAIGTLPS